MLSIAIAYDFDGTLTPQDMQEYSFFPELGIQEPKKDFWNHVSALSEYHDMDRTLTYMYLMLERARGRISLEQNAFVQRGRNIQYFPGVETWFQRINQYAKSLNINLKHYIISSGLREIIAGCSIAGEFSAIFASGFMYDDAQNAIWPAVAVNYTNKIQYLFCINKGIHNSWEHDKLNKYTPDNERPIPQNNIVYIGDGITDVPAMKVTREFGGYAIVVYDPASEKKKAQASELVTRRRADHALPTDYQEGSPLETHIKQFLSQRNDEYLASQ